MRVSQPVERHQRGVYASDTREPSMGGLETVAAVLHAYQCRTVVWSTGFELGQKDELSPAENDKPVRHAIDRLSLSSSTVEIL